jgi:hypothetical protein
VRERHCTSPGQRSFSDLLVLLHQELSAANVDHAFGGALALAFHVVRARATEDIDLSVSASSKKVSDVFRALPAGVKGDGRSVKIAETTGAVKLRWFRGISVNLFFPTNDFLRLALNRAETHRYQGVGLPFITATDLTVLKATFNRGTDIGGKEKDWLDIRMMLEAGTPDVKDAMAWIERLEGPNSSALQKLSALAQETMTQ